MDTILNSYDTSNDDFIYLWASQIATKFSYPVQEIVDVYSADYDTHNSEMRTRYMFKWNTFRRQTGTPFAYVNGVQLETFPEKAEDWMEILNTVYKSQWRPSTSSLSTAADLN